MEKVRIFSIIVLLILTTVPGVKLNAQPLNGAEPFVGAQVFIEPGISPERIDHLFRLMKENNLGMCRIRMFESYMNKDGRWDFTLFDHAFRSAHKYGVKVYATLFPRTGKTNIGGWKFPATQQQKEDFATYIRELVTHFKQFPSLQGWVLINEPGTDKIPDTPYVNAEWAAWDKLHPVPDFKANGYPVLMTTGKQAFLNDLNTSFLGWISAEIKKYDTAHDIHVNSHQIFTLCAQYDFSAWRSFLTSLGGSAHASWHFPIFSRQQYALAMLANAEIIRSGAGSMPWFMTELQGGNNTYSGRHAICPTREEIAQWIWITLGCEGKGSIFWMLNPRSSGVEAGEWAMVDFQDKPSERLLAAGEVATAVKAHAELFRNPQLIPSGVDVLYIKESLWAEELMKQEKDRYMGRQPDALMKSTLACFRALTERGLNVGLKEIKEYDFSQADYRGKSLIISHQIAVPERYRQLLENFVSRGGTLIVEGLTAFFDEDMHNTLNTGFTFEKLFGGNISEFKLVDNLFTIRVGEYCLPVHLWQGSIAGQETAAFTHSYGKGRVVWLPSTVGLGAWESNNYQPLSDYLYNTLPGLASAPSFNGYYPNVLMRTLKSGKETLVICINKSNRQEVVTLQNLPVTKGSQTIYAGAGCSVDENKLILSPEGILVIHL